MEIKWELEDLEIAREAEIPEEVMQDLGRFTGLAQAVVERLSMAFPPGDLLRLQTIWKASTGRSDDPASWARERLREIGMPDSMAMGISSQAFGNGLNAWNCPPRLFADFADHLDFDLPSTAAPWLLKNRAPTSMAPSPNDIPAMEGGE